MRKDTLRCWLLAVFLLLAPAPLLAENLLMVRTGLPFPAALEAAQSAIRSQGYTVAEVKNVDLGLLLMGYLSENYKAVFFGKAEEIRSLSRQFPELIPYLPLQILVFAEGRDTLLVSASPVYLATLFPQPELTEVFARWEQDLRTVLETVRDLPAKAH